VVKDKDSGEVIELHCIYDPATKGGDAPDGRKVKATLHWVSAQHAFNAEVRLYDHLFLMDNPMDDKDGLDFFEKVNPKSVENLNSCKLEPALRDAEPGYRCQFERLGYFCADIADSSAHNPIFNRIVSLRDTWAKVQKTQE
jgi:glutaminyl-tRNA synthetase